LTDRVVDIAFELVDCDPRFEIKEKVCINPFTRQPMTIKARVATWSPERKAAVRSLLDGRKALADEAGVEFVSVLDGTEIRLYFGENGAGGEGSEVGIAGDRISEEAATFLFEVMWLGDMALAAPFGGPVAVVDTATASKLKKRRRKKVVVGTPIELRLWLEEMVRREIE
jgi:hypothetical protein